MKSRLFARYGIVMSALVMAVSLLTIIPATPVEAYGNSQIRAKLAGGTEQAYNWDQDCYAQLRKLRNEGQAPRTAINNAPSYRYKTWLAPAASPSQTTPILVEYGQKEVPLQLHSIVFLCAALTVPKNKGADFAKTSAMGVITSKSSANDKQPGTGTNYPAMTANRYRINSATVTQGDGTLSPSLSGKTYSNTYKTDTRYWFASPISFKYIPNNLDGIVDIEQTVKISFKVTGVATFYTSDYECMSGRKKSNEGPRTATDYGRCNEKTINLTIKFKLKDKYELTPEVSVDDRTGEGTVEAGSGMTIESTVTQGVGDTATSETDWRVTELRYAPGVSLSEADIEAKLGSADPCGARPSANRTYCEIFRRTPDKIFDGSGATETYGYIADDVPVGTRICFVASVSRPTPADDPVWAHSAMVCSVVAKKPKVHILGSDLIVGKGQTSDIYGSRSVRNAGGTRYYGSWAEYAVLASGFVHDFASAAGYSGGTSDNHFCDVSLLTFTNSGASFCKDSNDSVSQGLYNLDSRTLPDVASRFSSSQGISGGTVDVSTANGIYTDNSSGSITVTSSGGAVGKGKSVVIVAPRATVTIDRDINYTTASDLKTMADIPQVVIIADRINIRSNVENVDAWLVATGTNGIINTCSNVTDPVAQLRSTNCNRQLTVNGPVIARHLYLYRTANAGTDANAAEPAEVFNLRPDAYLWATNYSQKAGRLQTVTSKELPPRF